MKRNNIFLSILLVGILNISLLAQETELVPDDLEDDTRYGDAVAITDNYLFVKSLKGIFIFEKDDENNWLQVGKVEENTHGYALSVFTDDLILIGHIFEDDDNGEVFVYRKTGEEWIYETSISPQGGPDHRYFGLMMAFSDNRLVVNASTTNSGETQHDMLYFYYLDSTEWIQQDRIDLPFIDGQGVVTSSIDITGEYAIVGYQNIIPPYLRGIFIFKREGNYWHLHSTLTIPDVTGNFGQRVSISGDYLAVGAPYDDGNTYNTGAVYIYHKEEDAWVLQTRIIADDGESSDNFGIRLKIRDSLLIVSALREGDNLIQYGAAYVYKLNNGEWIKKAKITSSERYEWDFFGYSVDISEEYALIGANYADQNGEDKGAAYVYDLPAVFNLTGTEEFEHFHFIEKNHKVFPNPVIDYLNIQFYQPLKKEARCILLDNLGRQIESLLLYKGLQNFKMAMYRLPQGVYFYRIVSGGVDIGSGKVVKAIDVR